MEANLITPMGLSTTGESLILSSVTLLDGDTGDLYIRNGKIIETSASTESIEVDCPRLGGNPRSNRCTRALRQNVVGCTVATSRANP